MSGALFDGFGTPIGNDVPVAFDGPGGVAVTYPFCQVLMGVEDGPADATWRDEGQFTVDFTYAVSQEEAPVSAAHLAHLVTAADHDGRIAFFGHSAAAINAVISQVLGFAGGGAA